MSATIPRTRLLARAFAALAEMASNSNMIGSHLYEARLPALKAAGLQHEEARTHLWNMRLVMSHVAAKRGYEALHTCLITLDNAGACEFIKECIETQPKLDHA